MKRFCYIIPKTPIEFQSPIRKRLWEITVQSLLKQTSKDWFAIIVDDTNRIDGPFHHITTEENKTKKFKLLTALKHIETLKTKPQYLIRLDDDDVVSPSLLEKLKNNDFDCYADKTKWFYDIVAKRFYINRRPWLTNTIIQKYDLALTVQKENNLPLLACNHFSFFNKFYLNTKIRYSFILSPVYVRILSPACLTLTHEFGTDQTGMDMDAYNKMLKKVQSNSWVGLKLIPNTFDKLKHGIGPLWWKEYAPYFNKLRTQFFTTLEKVY
jgi:glycosyltransferase involved in cell wall biosynthesis